MTHTLRLRKARTAQTPLFLFCSSPPFPPFSPPFPLPTPSSDPLPAPKFPHSFFRSPRSAHNLALLLSIPVHGVGGGRRIDLEFPGWLGFFLFVCLFFFFSLDGWRSELSRSRWRGSLVGFCCRWYYWLVCVVSRLSSLYELFGCYLHWLGFFLALFCLVLWFIGPELNADWEGYSFAHRAFDELLGYNKAPLNCRKFFGFFGVVFVNVLVLTSSLKVVSCSLYIWLAVWILQRTVQLLGGGLDFLALFCLSDSEEWLQ